MSTSVFRVSDFTLFNVYSYAKSSRSFESFHSSAPRRRGYFPFLFSFFKRREFALSRTYQIISGRVFFFFWYLLLLLTIHTIVIPTHYILIIFFPFSLPGCWRICVDIDVLGIEHNRACHNRGREKRELMLLSFDDIKGIEHR